MVDIKEAWWDLALDLENAIQTHREYPSIKEAGSSITKEGIEVTTKIINEFINDFNPGKVIPDEVLDQTTIHIEDYVECMQFLQNQLDTKKIEDCIIHITNTTQKDRLRLRQVLLDNDQKLYDTAGLNQENIQSTSYRFTNVNRVKVWFFNSDKPNITLEDFVQKFKKSDKLMNLAFYKESGTEWTSEEYNNITIFIGDSVDLTAQLISVKFIFDFGFKNSNNYYTWFKQEKEPNFKNCMQVAYENIFPVCKVNAKAVKETCEWKTPGICLNDLIEGQECCKPARTQKIEDYMMEQKTTKQMRDTGNVEVVVNIDGKQICEPRVKKVKTQLKQAKPWTGVIYYENGKYFNTIYAKTESKLHKRFQTSEFRDMTMRVHKYKYTMIEQRRFTKSK